MLVSLRWITRINGSAGCPPSEYIFKTQLENLADANGGAVPENIFFYTYAKPPLLTDEDVASIQPDYIVLDEFHRCGAQVWGAGVQAVLERHPDVPMLGLSATNIRYLGNQWKRRTAWMKYSVNTWKTMPENTSYSAPTRST